MLFPASTFGTVVSPQNQTLIDDVLLHCQSMTRGRIALERFRNSPWLRVTVVDRAGQRAWSNPIWR